MHCIRLIHVALSTPRLLASSTETPSWQRLRILAIPPHSGTRATRLLCSCSSSVPPRELQDVSSQQLSDHASLIAAPEHTAESSLEAALYIVSTPIGNLKDITIRAIDVLKSASVIYAEDTRHTRKLLTFYNIKTPLQSFHAHNEKGKENIVLDKLAMGQAVALVSDAGTPAISDPGAMLVAAAVKRGLKVVPVPGASAVLSTVVAAGLPTDRFMFCGFLPPKSGERRRQLADLRSHTCPLVFYIAPHNLGAVLADAAEELGGSRRCCLARELTKLHEEFLRCSLAEAAVEYAEREPRGEFVLMVAGAEPEEQLGADDGVALLTQHLKAGLSVSAAAKLASQQLGMPRKALYEVALRLAEEVRSA